MLSLCVGDIIGSEDELNRILAVWEGPVQDFGGGVKDILAEDFVDIVGNSYVRWSRKTGIPRKRMREIIEECRRVAGFSRVYGGEE